MLKNKVLQRPYLNPHTRDLSCLSCNTRHTPPSNLHPLNPKSPKIAIKVNNNLTAPTPIKKAKIKNLKVKTKGGKTGYTIYV